MALLTTTSVRRQLRAAMRWCEVSFLVLGFACAFPDQARAQTAPSAENQVKAVFLFNFAQFVEWPATAFADAHASLVIGVLGDDPFGSYLDELVKGEHIGDRPMSVRRFHRLEEISDCHILFIARSESGQMANILSHLHGRHLLTVGDTDNFNRQGGIIRLVTEGGKIRLKIVVEVAKAEGLTISSKLLGPATVVPAEK